MAGRKKKDGENWGNDCFAIFIGILSLTFFFGGWISGAGFGFSLIMGLIILGIGSASMGTHI